MVEKTELILICLVAVAPLAIVARKIRIPYPILLTIGGVVLALVPGLPAIHLDPQLVFNLFLPPLLYPAAVYTSWRNFRGNLRSILALAGPPKLRKFVSVLAPPDLEKTDYGPLVHS
jgi:monovalent cation/hydrogen antiporter